jgi:hypothetical protein
MQQQIDTTALRGFDLVGQRPVWSRAGFAWFSLENILGREWRPHPKIYSSSRDVLTFHPVRKFVVPYTHFKKITVIYTKTGLYITFQN